MRRYDNFRINDEIINFSWDYYYNFLPTYKKLGYIFLALFGRVTAKHKYKQGHKITYMVYKKKLYIITVTLI